MAKKYNADNVFKALADPTRRELFHILMLATTALSLTQLSSQFDISRQGVTKHVMLLHDAGLVKIETVGRERFCEANPTPLTEIKNWLAVYDRFWDDKLRKLDDYLGGEKS